MVEIMMPEQVDTELDDFFARLGRAQSIRREI